MGPDAASRRGGKLLRVVEQAGTLLLDHLLLQTLAASSVPRGPPYVRVIPRRFQMRCLSVMVAPCYQQVIPSRCRMLR